MIKIAFCTIVLLIACNQTLANFSGGDTFNDNSMDTAKWTNFVAEAGTSLSEANGRLEFEATGVGVNRSHAWKWIANTGSYTNDWIISVDTVNQLDENLISSSSNETWFGCGVYFGSFSNSFSIDRNKGNDGFGYHDIVAEGSIADVSQFKEYRTATNDDISFSIAFHADTKTLSCSYDQGGGSVHFTHMDVSAWGMTDTDVFEPYIYGGSRGVVVGSGDVYADNFTAASDDMFTVNANASIYCSSILGSWILGDSTTKDSAMITFMTNGTYFLAHDGVPDSGGQPGMERGTYVWNTNSGVFSAITTVDTTGDWGLSDPNGGVDVEVDGDTLYYKPAFEDLAVLKRVYSPYTPPSIVGGWSHVGPPVPTHNNVAVAFLPNGIYFFAQDGDSVYDPNGQDGMERGVYSWNPVTGEFLAIALTDTCGQWGFSHPDDSFTFTVNGNEMLLKGFFLLERVVNAQCSDLDGDGLPDVWEQQYYGNPTNAPANGNVDGDHLDNRSEYVAGTNPTNGASVFSVSGLGASPSGIILNWTAVEGRCYGVNWTDNLTNSLTVLTNGIAYPQNSYTDTVHSAEGAAFYNVDVRLEN